MHRHPLFWLTGFSVGMGLLNVFFGYKFSHENIVEGLKMGGCVWAWCQFVLTAVYFAFQAGSTVHLESVEPPPEEKPVPVPWGVNGRPPGPYFGPWNGTVVMVEQDGSVREMGLSDHEGLIPIGHLSDPRFDSGWGVPAVPAPEEVPDKAPSEPHPVQHPLVDRIFDLFHQLCRGLDTDMVTGELTLDPDGTGSFHLLEQIAYERVVFPAWAKRQRFQCGWNTQMEGVLLLAELLEHRRALEEALGDQ